MIIGEVCSVHGEYPCDQTPIFLGSLASTEHLCQLISVKLELTEAFSFLSVCITKTSEPVFSLSLTRILQLDLQLFPPHL